MGSDLNHSRPGWHTSRAVSAATNSLLLAVLLAALIAVIAARDQREVEAYSFDWPSQPYLRDDYGNYAYSDLTFTWGTWASWGSYFSNIQSCRCRMNMSA
jgi:hypothetical protein